MMEFGVGGGMLIWSSEPHGQTSLVGYSPQGYKESDTTDKLTHFVLCRQTTKMPLNHEASGHLDRIIYIPAVRLKESWP